MEEDQRGNFVPQSGNFDTSNSQQAPGLVYYSDIKKRPAEFQVLDNENGAHKSTFDTLKYNSNSQRNPSKKRKYKDTKKSLSFATDEDSGEEKSSQPTSSGNKPNAPVSTNKLSRRLGPNASVDKLPRVLTKSARAKDVKTRQRLQKEFENSQEAVKRSEILIPFVFYNGTNIPGGVCQMRKGDQAWLFLDKARKLGAQLGVGGSGKEWARVGVDDLMLVRSEVIIPHHYEFYYFIINNVQGFNGPLFEFSDSLREETKEGGSFEKGKAVHDQSLDRSSASKQPSIENAIEGADHDASVTKVVDRRWYETQKHQYPMSNWVEFDPSKDYAKSVRKDTHGNSYFFS